MALTKNLPERHEPVVGRADDFTWRLERVWSCPLHDHDENEWLEDPDEVTCNSCLVAGWMTYYDEDGWAYLVFEERDAFTKALLAYYLPTIQENLNEDLSIHLRAHEEAGRQLEHS